MKIGKLPERIRNELSESRYVTAKEIAERLDVSEKTVRHYISVLNDTLRTERVEAKHGSGYRLVARDADLIDALENGAEMNALPDGNEERAEYIICELLLNSMSHEIRGGAFSDLYDLCDTLCVSESTMASCIRRVKEILREYNLDVVTHRKKGVRVEGDEFDIRICMSDYIDRYKILNKLPIEQIESEKRMIAETMLNVFSRHEVSAPEISVNKLINHVFITVYRNHTGNYIHFTADEHRYIEGFDSVAVTVARETCDALENMFNIKFTSDDYDYIAVYMVGQRMKRQWDKGNYNLVIPSEIQELVVEILNFLYDTIRVDYRDNFTVRMNLIIHMVSMAVRLKYNLKIANPLLQDIKNQYSYGYAVACQAVIVIEKRYGKKISEDEIGYLGIIFEEARQRLADGKIRNRRKNIVIVCATGKAGAQILARQYQKVFGEYLDEVTICNPHELRDLDYSEINYVISTAHVDVNIPVPILETKLMLSGEDVFRLQKKFEQSEDTSLTRYFSPDLFFPALECDSKEEILKFMCEEISKYHNVADGFFESVMQRESMGTTDLGELVAIPHPYGRVTDDTFACVATLLKPVFWGNRCISVVVLISIASDESGDMDAFFQAASEFMLAPDKARSLLRSPTFSHFMDLLHRE